MAILVLAAFAAVAWGLPLLIMDAAQQSSPQGGADDAGMVFYRESVSDEDVYIFPLTPHFHNRGLPCGGLCSVLEDVWCTTPPSHPARPW